MEKKGKSINSVIQCKHNKLNSQSYHMLSMSDWKVKNPAGHVWRAQHYLDQQLSFVVLIHMVSNIFTVSVFH